MSGPAVFTALSVKICVVELVHALAVLGHLLARRLDLLLDVGHVLVQLEELVDLRLERAFDDRVREVRAHLLDARGRAHVDRAEHRRGLLDADLRLAVRLDDDAEQVRRAELLFARAGRRLRELVAGRHRVAHVDDRALAEAVRRA